MQTFTVLDFFLGGGVMEGCGGTTPPYFLTVHDDVVTPHVLSHSQQLKIKHTAEGTTEDSLDSDTIALFLMKSNTKDKISKNLSLVKGP